MTPGVEVNIDDHNAIYIFKIQIYYCTELVGDGRGGEVWLIG